MEISETTTAYDTLYLIFAAIFVLGLWRFLSRSAAKRSARFVEVGRSLGLRYADSIEEAPLPPILVGPGAKRGGIFTLEGSYAGLEVTVFEHHYREFGRDVSETVFAFRNADCPLPAFLLQPPSGGYPAAAAGAGIAFVDDPEFAKAFRLRGAPGRDGADSPAEARIRALFGPSNRQRLLAASPVCVGAWEDRLAIWVTGRDLPPEAVPAQLAAATEIARLFWPRTDALER